MDLLGELYKTASAEGIEIEHFETYKPSLNDIFVERVGEEENVASEIVKDADEDESEGGEDNE
jgi:ABC-2 type transport system ATP-binding protein